MESKLTLFHYWRSSCSWRVRMALNWKSIPVQYVHVNLLDGEVDGAEHRARNPGGYVPTLRLDSKHQEPVFLSESVAILEWLEETSPARPLLPSSALERAITRQMVELVNSGIQPLQNINVLDRLEELQKSPEIRTTWTVEWIARGLTAYETLLNRWGGTWSMGNQITFADLCLVPQVYNAIRNSMDLKPYPKVHAIYEAALKLPEVAAAHPDRFQPPAVSPAV